MLYTLQIYKDTKERRKMYIRIHPSPLRRKGVGTNEAKC
jgi:hypothetical protein